MITPNGKELEFYNEGFMTKVRFKGGGELPDVLKGGWTNQVFAKQAIDMYLKALSDKSKKNTDKR